MTRVIGVLECLEKLRILAALHSLRADNIVYPLRMSAETFRLHERLLRREACATNRRRNRYRTITSPPQSRSISRARSLLLARDFGPNSGFLGSDPLPLDNKLMKMAIIGSTPSRSARSGGDGGAYISRGTRMRLQTGGLVPRRVTLMTYTSTRVFGLSQTAVSSAKNLAKERIASVFLLTETP